MDEELNEDTLYDSGSANYYLYALVATAVLGLPLLFAALFKIYADHQRHQMVTWARGSIHMSSQSVSQSVCLCVCVDCVLCACLCMYMHVVCVCVHVRFWCLGFDCHAYTFVISNRE